MTETRLDDGLDARLRDLAQTLVEFEHVAGQRIVARGRNQCGLFGSNDCLVHLGRVRDRASAVVEAVQATPIQVRNWRFIAIIGWACAAMFLAGWVAL